MNEKSENTVVVTGGAGFIGSHLVGSLADRGYHVTILDDLSTGKKENIEHLLVNDNVEFHRGSIADIDVMKILFKDVKYVFHLAALASVPLSLDDPLTCHEVNSTGTLKVLTAARELGVAKVVSVSSCAVYGDTEAMPISEETPLNPLSPYAVAKMTGEQYCRIFTRLYGLSTVSMRFFNIYGPRQDPDSPYSAVIPIFIKRLIDGKTPFIDGDGEQTRDFTFVDDAVAACILAAETDASGEYNVGSGTTTTINRLVRLIAEISGKDIKPEYRDSRPGDVKYSSPDISRISRLGYQPKYSIDEGLKITAEAMMKK